MALTVEDGTGKTNAESYLSVSDADTYHSSFGNTSWSALTTANKEMALRKATRYLDNRFRARWVGSRSNRDQALDWPRYGAIDLDGYLIDYNMLPEDLKRATAEAALRSSQGTDLESDVTADNSGVVESSSFQAGPVSISETFSAKTSDTTYTVIDRLVGSLVQDNAVGRG